jgi:hypothetical protein
MKKNPVPSSGTPRTTFPRAAPSTTANSADANEKVVSQNSRHNGFS